MPNAFFVKIESDTVILDEWETRHLRVTRVKPGECLLGLDGKGALVEFVLVDIGENGSRGLVLSMKRFEKDDYRVTTWVAATKWKRLRLILEKATELGADRILIFEADKSTLRKADNTIEKCRKVIREAMKQSLNPHIPELDWMSRVDEKFAGNSLFLHLDIDGKPLNTIVSQLVDRHETSIVVGPEGGYSEREKGTTEYFLDSRIVGIKNSRVETAVISALSIVNNFIGRF